MARVPAAGETVGEIMLRGNTVMKGYLKNKAATGAAFEGGWFRTDDVAVCHPDGYVEIKDRTEDIIAWCRDNLARYKVPKTVDFAELPMTSTGKIQKFILREAAQGL